MKKVLITGGAGFIGANAVCVFLNLGNEVHVLEYPGCNLWRLEDIRERIDIQEIDITNYQQVEGFIKNLKPDIILHFAAYGAYQRIQQDVEQTIDTNLLGTINLVNACSTVGFEAFIYTGSSSEYGIKEKLMKESDALEANNLYGMTKAAATLYCQNAAKKQKLPIVIMRPFAVYGPFEDKKRLIPTVIAAYLKNESPVLSSRESVRDFIFVEDLIMAYKAAIDHIEDVKGEIFNIGTGVEHTIVGVVAIVKDLTNSKLEPEYGIIKPNQEEPKHWVADISKAKRLLDWEPQHTMEQGIKKTITWFEKFYGL